MEDADRTTASWSDLAFAQQHAPYRFDTVSAFTMMLTETSIVQRKRVTTGKGRGQPSKMWAGA